MNKRKLQKFCSIQRFLQQYNPNLYELYEDLCLVSLLRPRGKNQGLTFMMPDKKATTLIQKKTYSDNPEEADKILRSLIIKSTCNTMSDWTRDGNIVDSMNFKVNVDKNKSNTNKIVLADRGITLEKNKKFIELQRHYQKMPLLNVWDITDSGKLPNTDKLQKVEYNPDANKSMINNSTSPSEMRKVSIKRGGLINKMIGGTSDENRKAFAILVEYICQLLGNGSMDDISYNKRMAILNKLISIDWPEDNNFSDLYTSLLGSNISNECPECPKMEDIITDKNKADTIIGNLGVTFEDAVNNFKNKIKNLDSVKSEFESVCKAIKKTENELVSNEGGYRNLVNTLGKNLREGGISFIDNYVAPNLNIFGGSIDKNTELGLYTLSSNYKQTMVGGNNSLNSTSKFLLTLAQNKPAIVGGISKHVLNNNYNDYKNSGYFMKFGANSNGSREGLLLQEYNKNMNIGIKGGKGENINTFLNNLSNNMSNNMSNNKIGGKVEDNNLSYNYETFGGINNTNNLSDLF